MNQAIEKEFLAFPNTFQSIQGICPLYCSAGTFSEIGDIHRFHTEEALAKFADLNWKQYTSGNFEAEETHMSKSSNEYLRYYFIEATNALRVHNAEYRAYNETKFKKVTKYQPKRALALTTRRLVRLVYALLKRSSSIEQTISRRPRQTVYSVFKEQLANINLFKKSPLAKKFLFSFFA